MPEQTPQSITNMVNPHDVTAHADAGQDKQRNVANYFGERNFIGNRIHNIGGVANGGCLQVKRLSGTVFQSAIVGA